MGRGFVKDSAAEWIRQNANFEHQGNQKTEIERLVHGATSAGYEVTFSGARSAFYAARNRRKKKKARTATSPIRQVLTPGTTIIHNVAKELQLLTQEVKRLQKVEEAYNAVLAAVAKK